MNSIPMSMNVVERFGLIELAKQRQALKESRDISTQKVDKKISDLELHYVGLKAEHAVAKLLGLEINMENTYAGDGGIDLRYRGLTVDVKFTSRHFNVRATKEFVSDIAVLVNPLYRETRWDGRYYAAIRDLYVPSKPKFAWVNCLIIGWIKKDEYYALRKWTKGTVDYWSVSADNMHDMYTLKKYAISLSTKKNLESVWANGDTA